MVFEELLVVIVVVSMSLRRFYRSLKMSQGTLKRFKVKR